MQIVIKIPEREYERLMNMKYPMTATVLETAIRRGTPLPKGHGDLIDRNKLNIPPEEMVARMAVQCASVVIEADREVQE